METHHNAEKSVVPHTGTDEKNVLTRADFHTLTRMMPWERVWRYVVGATGRFAQARGSAVSVWETTAGNHIHETQRPILTILVVLLFSVFSAAPSNAIVSATLFSASVTIPQVRTLLSPRGQT